MSDPVGILIPDWPAPSNVRAYSTNRLGGVSLVPYHSLNLGDHVGDSEEAVKQNRQYIQQQLSLPSSPVWLQQVHGSWVHRLSDASVGVIEADASFSDKQGMVCVVMTADCLPLLICNRAGTVVAAVHAGWRGLCDGVIESTIRRLGCLAEELLVWLGPAIGPQAFEVGQEVYDAFVAKDPQAAEAFSPKGRGYWLASLYLLARQRLHGLGVHHVYGGDFCTYSQHELFFSYRRDGVTGRMASLIWLS